MLFNRKNAVVLASLAARSFVNGQNFTQVTNGLSTNCTAAAAPLIASGFGRCANLLGLIAAAGAQSGLGHAIGSWADGLCAQQCSDDDIQQATRLVNSSCAEDLAANRSVPTLIYGAIINYDQVRDGACAQSSGNNSYCAVQLIYDVEQANNITLTIGAIIGLASNQTLLTKVPPTELCSDCNKFLFEIVEDVLTDPAPFNASASQICGAPFVDGDTPDTVTIVTAPDTNSTSPSSPTGPSTGGNNGTSGGSGGNNGGSNGNNGGSNGNNGGSSSGSSTQTISASLVGFLTFVTFATGLIFY